MCEEDHHEFNYMGPRHLGADVPCALERISEALRLQHLECDSHSTIIVENFRNNIVLEATAVYLVAAISQCISTNLGIRQALFNESTHVPDLNHGVAKVIGADNEDAHFNQYVRDPWIWEGISHMLPPIKVQC